MEEVKIAAVAALGRWLSHSTKLTPEAKQLYLGGRFHTVDFIPIGLVC